jgi:hypothetical protein
MSNTPSRFAPKPVILLSMQQHPSRRGNIGIGLLVLLIVVAIALYVMFGMQGKGTVGAAAQSRATAQTAVFNINTQQLAILISDYRQQHDNKLPKSPADLEAPPSTFTDPWGGQITFEFKEDPIKGTIVTFRSAGKDGKMNTPDDVVASSPLPY